MRVVLLVPVVFLLLASFVAADNDTTSCETALDNFPPCMYVAPAGGTVPDTCCNGLRIINELGGPGTPSERQTVCSCIKVVLVDLPPDGAKIIATYPGRCGVNLFFKLDPSVDCDSLD